MNLKDYYLEQMGYTQWQYQPRVHQKSKLLIVTDLPYPFIDEYLTLWQDMLKCLNVSNHEFKFSTPGMYGDFIKEDPSQIIWFWSETGFGLDLMHGENTVCSASLKQLLENPLEKKRVYLDILRIKNHLSNAS